MRSILDQALQLAILGAPYERIRGLALGRDSASSCLREPSS